MRTVKVTQKKSDFLVTDNELIIKPFIGFIGLNNC
jgi:hypothetical protein